MNGVIYFLNVKEGDCNIIKHDSGRVSVIDICNGNADEEERLDESAYVFAKSGNYHQKDHPVDPIKFMSELGITDIFRFILTHPDMDHMDGIERLFKVHDVENFWDTDNKELSQNKLYIFLTNVIMFTILLFRSKKEIRVWQPLIKLLMS